MVSTRKREQPYWRFTEWRNRTTQHTGFCSSLDGAVAASYLTFVSGEGFPDEVATPDGVVIGVEVAAGDAEVTEQDDRASLPTLWDRWLERHPEERAEWDVGSRTARLQALRREHMPDPRPFTSESIVARPDWYRRLYGIIGMTDDMFDTFLHLNRFAVADKEAQRLAKEQETTSPRTKASMAVIYLENYVDGDSPEPPTVPIETQERACRAYCKHMGYKVHKVCRAMQPPPKDAPLRREIGVVPGAAFEYYLYESRHPYHEARNLLQAHTVDVLVEFIEGGPSRSLYGDEPAGKATRHGRVEWASLWEIEPPTDNERRLHELLDQLGQAETEEGIAALDEQIRVVAKAVAEQRKSSKPLTNQPVRRASPVKVPKPKLCFACRSQPARAGSAFCCDACAQSAAERLVLEQMRGWCSICEAWIGSDGCIHLH